MTSEEIVAAGFAAMVEIAAGFQGGDDGYPTDEEAAKLNYVKEAVEEILAEQANVGRSGGDLVLRYRRLAEDALRYGDPHSAAIYSQQADEALQYGWTRYEGPHGGKGWQNEAGDVKYQDEEPGARAKAKPKESQEQPQAPPAKPPERGAGGLGSMMALLGKGKAQDAAKVTQAAGNIKARLDADAQSAGVHRAVLKHAERMTLWTKEVNRTRDAHSRLMSQYVDGRVTLAAVDAAKKEHTDAKAELEAWTQRDLPKVMDAIRADRPIPVALGEERGGLGAIPARVRKSAAHGMEFIKHVLGHAEGEEWLSFEPKLQRWPLERSECHNGAAGTEEAKTPYLRIADRVEDPAITVHEAGHGLETFLPGALEACKQFLAHRCGSESAVSLREKFGDAYDAHETGRKDQFDRVYGKDSPRSYYVGKDYGDKGSELLSMGVEALYRDPVHFAIADPEWFRFTIGVLHGSLRGKQA